MLIQEAIQKNKEFLAQPEISLESGDISPLLMECLDATDATELDGVIKTWLQRSLTKNKGRSIEQLQFIAQQAYLCLSKLINRQLDAVLHHPQFKALESSWCGLRYLTDIESDYDEDLTIKIKVLNVTWRELGKDLTRAIEFDQSNIFKRIYSDEFDTPGGEPYGVVLGDYSVTHRTRKGFAVNDLDVIEAMSSVAEAALCPFISSVEASLFGLDSLRDLSQPINLSEIFKQQEYFRFNQLRNNESTRFVGLVLPDMLMRQPYDDDDTHYQAFNYQERIVDPDRDLLWGNSCYSFGGVLIRAFANTGWFADIRGGVHDFGEGGVVRNLQYAKNRYTKNSSPKVATKTQIDDFLERELSDLGFIPLCSYHSIEHSVFYSNSSLHKSSEYTSEVASANAKLSSMLQYIMCVSRFGHYVKVIGRDKVGSFIGVDEFQRIFQNWLNKYTTSSDVNSTELKARYPLSMSKVSVYEKPGKPGSYSCILHLQPHFQLDQLVSSIKLITELASGAGSTATALITNN